MTVLNSLENIYFKTVLLAEVHFKIQYLYLTYCTIFCHISYLRICFFLLLRSNICEPAISTAIILQSGNCSLIFRDVPANVPQLLTAINNLSVLVRYIILIIKKNMLSKHIYFHIDLSNIHFRVLQYNLLQYESYPVHNFRSHLVYWL